MPVICFFAGFFLYNTFWPTGVVRMEGHSDYVTLAILDLLFLAGAALAVMACVYSYRRTRPIALDDAWIATLGGRDVPTTKIEWPDVVRIERQNRLDSVEMTDQFVFEIHGKNALIRFEDTIENLDALLDAINHKIEALGFPASDIERGTHLLKEPGAVRLTPRERSELLREGRRSKVTRF